MYVDKSLILEVDSYKLIEDLIKCEICKELLNDPVQCTTCDNIFCQHCFEEYILTALHCPFKCKSPASKPCRIANNLLDNFTFKCVNNCGSVIKYSNLEEHYHKVCSNKNYPELIKSVIAKIDKVKQENAKLQEQQTFKSNSALHCHTKSHLHPLVMLTTFRNGWNCNVCMHLSKGTIKSYYCTLCDYDMCVTCYANEINQNNNFNAH